jgi:hypothetical protein
LKGLASLLEKQRGHPTVLRWNLQVEDFTERNFPRLMEDSLPLLGRYLVYAPQPPGGPGGGHAWDVEPGRVGQFVQLVSLQRRAYHAGREGNDWIGIALSGPWSQDPRAEHEREAFHRLVWTLVDAFDGTLEWWCKHSDITRGKRDPGPGFDAGAWIGDLLKWKKGPK